MYRKSILLTTALVSGAGVAYAGDKPLYQPAPAWVVAPVEPDLVKLGDSDPMIVILDQQQRMRDGEVLYYLDQATRVASAQMLTDVGQVKLQWQPDEGDLIVHRAEIIRGAQRIDLIATGQRLQVLQREEQMEQLQLNGTLTATMAVEGLRVGDVLRFAYTVTSRDKALQGNVQAFQPLMADPMRAKFARARISWPSGSPVRWRLTPDTVRPTVAKKDGFDAIEVALPLAKQPEMPADAPTRYRQMPLIEASSFADWAAVSKVLAPLYDTSGKIAPGSPLAAEVAKIATKTNDPRRRAALALQLVQDEVRYLFKGMDGGNYIPQQPAQTWELRYGDCKAKTLLLLALLRALGVDAEAVAANTSLGDQVPQRLASPGAFDHVLVRAVIDGKSLWLDGTGAGSRLADLDDTPPFRHVLPLRVVGSGLMPIEARASARPLAEVDLELDQRAGLGLPTLFTMTTVLRGPPAGMIQAAAGQMGKEQIRQGAQAMANQLFGEAMISEGDISYDAETATAQMKASGVVTTRWRMAEGRYRMTLDKTIEDLDFQPDRVRPAWKEIPVANGMIGTVVYRVRVKLPGEGEGFSLEGDQTLPATLAGAHPVRKTRLADGMITVEDRIENLGAEIAAADIAATRAQVALAKTRLLKAIAPERYPARWKTVAEARRDGGVDRLLAAYAKGIAADSDEVTGYRNRASFLAGIWDWKGAAADYDKAIELAPDGDLYLARSRVRQALRDDAGALADAEAALGLDASSTAAIDQVAVLRFRKGERKAALALVGERIAAGGKEELELVGLQSQLLGEDGRAEEGVAVLDAAIKATPGKAGLFNSRCWLKATTQIALETALKDCTRGIEMAEQPAAIYDSRALVYYRMGRLEEALGDLDAALEVAPSQTASLYLRGVVRQRMKDKAGEEDLAAARLMWPRIDEDYARYGIKP
jgi:tetratricopeptide (TPR) repeat protein